MSAQVQSVARIQVFAQNVILPKAIQAAALCSEEYHVNQYGRALGLTDWSQSQRPVLTARLPRLMGLCCSLTLNGASELCTEREGERSELERNGLWWVMRLCQLRPTCTVHKSENISWSENLDLQLWGIFLDEFWEVTSRDLKTQNPGAEKPSVCAQGKRSEFNLYTLQKGRKVLLAVP